MTSNMTSIKAMRREATSLWTERGGRAMEHHNNWNWGVGQHDNE
jgi:hypothetical protein